jgi:hypothetical protein
LYKLGYGSDASPHFKSNPIAGSSLSGKDLPDFYPFTDFFFKYWGYGLNAVTFSQFSFLMMSHPCFVETPALFNN